MNVILAGVAYILLGILYVELRVRVGRAWPDRFLVSEDLLDTAGPDDVMELRRRCPDDRIDPFVRFVMTIIWPIALLVVLVQFVIIPYLIQWGQDTVDRMTGPSRKDQPPW